MRSLTLPGLESSENKFFAGCLDLVVFRHASIFLLIEFPTIGMSLRVSEFKTMGANRTKAVYSLGQSDDG